MSNSLRNEQPSAVIEISDSEDEGKSEREKDDSDYEIERESGTISASGQEKLSGNFRNTVQRTTCDAKVERSVAQNKGVKRSRIVDVVSTSEESANDDYDNSNRKDKSRNRKSKSTGNAKSEKPRVGREKRKATDDAEGVRQYAAADRKMKNKTMKMSREIDIVSSSEDESPPKRRKDSSSGDDKYDYSPESKMRKRYVEKPMNKAKGYSEKENAEETDTGRREAGKRKGAVDNTDGKASKTPRIITLISSSEDEMPVKTQDGKKREKRNPTKADRKISNKRSRVIDVVYSSEDEMPLRPEDDNSKDCEHRFGREAKNRKRKERRDDSVTEDRTTRAKGSSKVGNADDEIRKKSSKNSAIKVSKDAKGSKVTSVNDAVACDEWSISEYISEFNNVDGRTAENIVNLIRDENTIPFISRYRKEMTGGMEPEQLRRIKDSYDQAISIKKRAGTILRSIDKLGKWSPDVHAAIKAAKSINELDHIYSPFKPDSPRALAERARELGLGPVSEAFLQGLPLPDFSSLINPSKDGLKNKDQVKDGVVHIIADVISKDQTMFEKIRELRRMTFTIETKLASAAKQKEVDDKKYETYIKFQASVTTIRPYQILAINRGEAQKILSVKINIPDMFQHSLRNHCLERFKIAGRASHFHRQLLEESINDAYNRLIKPLVVRQTRHAMNERAERASTEVFALNLKKLLLSRPYRGKTVLGIDPGFKHGCKLAVVSEQGNVLDTATIYPFTSYGAISNNQDSSGRILTNLIRKYNCSTVALGNAKACRETETLLTRLIQSGAFAPHDVSYAIVDEAGASVYSCSPEAKSEFPNLDPNLISAVSIARRLQDPLAELVKVEPKHLGVGMYQHDLPEKHLQLILSEVITETVSFVGVDINTASHCLLRRVAGLNAARATNIIERRNMIGPFTNRNQLLEVRSIGKKSYEQCAGFIRILPETALTTDELRNSINSINHLDQTWIHPESYDIANKFMKRCNCDARDLGSRDFINKITAYANEICFGNLAQQFGTSVTTIEVIVSGLSMPRGEDIRVKEEAPLFRKNVRNVDDLSIGVQLSGLVRNVTDFGAFVDIGVGISGLIHVSQMKGQTLSLGQRVEVEVRSIEKESRRIALGLVTML